MKWRARPYREKNCHPTAGGTDGQTRPAVHRNVRWHDGGTVRVNVDTIAYDPSRTLARVDFCIPEPFGERVLGAVPLRGNKVIA